MYCLTLTGWQWLMSFICIPVRMNPMKAHWRKGSGPFSFERSATSPPQADLVLVDLFFIRGGWGGCTKALPTVLPRPLCPEHGFRSGQMQRSHKGLVRIFPQLPAPIQDTDTIPALPQKWFCHMFSASGTWFSKHIPGSFYPTGLPDDYWLHIH